jgi:hypothetical protein
MQRIGRVGKEPAREKPDGKNRLGKYRIKKKGKLKRKKKAEALLFFAVI